MGFRGWFQVRFPKKRGHGTLKNTGIQKPYTLNQLSLQACTEGDRPKGGLRWTISRAPGSRPIADAFDDFDLNMLR